MWVPGGTAHLVINLHENVKIALDLVTPRGIVRSVFGRVMEGHLRRAATAIRAEGVPVPVQPQPSDDPVGAIAASLNILSNLV